ncbi:ribonuclease P protein component [Formivibrio citricus]|nr:ribonuclease P protein component [Formivibrio citricus]
MRLLKTDDFSSVFSLRCSRGDAWFQVLSAPNGLPHARLGVVVGKKVDRRAVGRNAIKRLVRETFRTHPEGLVGLDIVVRARRPIAPGERAQARAALLVLLNRSGKCRT